ncbi:MAG: cytochrome c maturation protein CcmE [Robiginitomaculum sp.]|nr:cytochrome c maturation protein CcmE [Robiginitomaculum sp.]
MKPRNRNRRLTFLGLGLLVLVAALVLAMAGLKDNISYFYAPTELLAEEYEADKSIRLGGMVEDGSFQRSEGLQLSFRITDFNASIPVVYSKILPDLFREGQGVIAEGALGSDGVFVATRILAKHDEKYMPPEVAQSLKKQDISLE